MSEVPPFPVFSGMSTHFTSATNHPCTFRTECVRVDRISAATAEVDWCRRVTSYTPGYIWIGGSTLVISKREYAESGSFGYLRSLFDNRDRYPWFSYREHGRCLRFHRSIFGQFVGRPAVVRQVLMVLTVLVRVLTALFGFILFRLLARSWGKSNEACMCMLNVSPPAEPNVMSFTDATTCVLHQTIGSRRWH